MLAEGVCVPASCSEAVIVLSHCAQACYGLGCAIFCIQSIIITEAAALTLLLSYSCGARVQGGGRQIPDGAQGHSLHQGHERLPTVWIQQHGGPGTSGRTYLAGLNLQHMGGLVLIAQYSLRATWQCVRWHLGTLGWRKYCNLGVVEPARRFFVWHACCTFSSELLSLTRARSLPP